MLHSATLGSASGEAQALTVDKYDPVPGDAVSARSTVAVVVDAGDGGSGTAGLFMASAKLCAKRAGLSGPLDRRRPLLSSLPGSLPLPPLPLPFLASSLWAVPAASKHSTAKQPKS